MVSIMVPRLKMMLRSPQRKKKFTDTMHGVGTEFEAGMYLLGNDRIGLESRVINMSLLD